MSNGQSITITYVDPIVLVRQSTMPLNMVIVGTNFSPSATTVTIGGVVCPIVSINTTTIECNPVCSGPNNQENLVVTIGATPSNAVLISRIDVFRIDQYYDGAYWIGSNFDNAFIDKSKVSTGNTSSLFLPTTFINSTHLHFPKHKDLTFTTDLGYDSKVIFRSNAYWSPLIQSTMVDSSQTPYTFYIYGYFYNNGPYVITVGLQSCTNPIVENGTTTKCNLIYVPTGVYQLNILDSHNQNTLFVVNDPVPPINITTFSITANTITFTGQFPLKNPKFSLHGVSSTPIAAKSYTATSIVFDFTVESQCGDGYIVDSLVLATTNSMLICPTPVIQSISQPLTNGGPFTITGKNLNPFKIGTSNLIYYFKFIIAGGTIKNGTFNSISLDSSKSLQTLILNAPSGSGTFSLEFINLVNSSISTSKNLQYQNPYISACSSTKFNVSSLVTISGSSFDSTLLTITIGNSTCLSPLVNDNRNQITCTFLSLVAPTNPNNPLEIFISVNGLTSSQYMFLYTKAGMDCPSNKTTGIKCSGNGDCNNQMKCDCYPDWEGMDCSMQVVTSSLLSVQPVINSNDLSSLMKSPSGNMFDVGLQLIREENFNNQLVESFQMNQVIWRDDSSSPNQFQYSGLLPNNATINVEITLNNQSERIYYNFAGDKIPILPKSVKYQLKVSNWPFRSSLNQILFIFKSGVEMVSQKGCNQQIQSTNSLQMAGDSLRNVQISLSNGEVLMGTFSDRIMIDGRVSYNQVTGLNQTQLLSLGLNINNNPDSIYTMIKSNSFTNNVIVDPNFGVLVSLSKNDESNQDCAESSEPSNKWKLPVIIVCAVVGVALIVGATIVVIQKNRINIKILSEKMKSIKS
ncbi:hypothetical protein CYY_006719 [Polysphondylium violaceum]|uniref:EGF-like domain-containing protein n=1 Tax=Polysphondylium violaceum TaxID=133409 RepID=A0A8J4PQX6_9MYCE|nr:hypothetical protein CYY_006719 [Polysphondylium violaceum]